MADLCTPRCYQQAANLAVIMASTFTASVCVFVVDVNSHGIASAAIIPRSRSATMSDRSQQHQMMIQPECM
jgi:hypothetical protein